MTKRKTATGCNCIYKVNEALKKEGSNTRLEVPFFINMQTGNPAPPKCLLKTCKADSKKREPLRTIVATYCPICGKKYPEAARATAER